MNSTYILSRLSKSGNEQTDKMIWVGKDYSLYDLKQDLAKIDEYYKNLYKRRLSIMKDEVSIAEIFEAEFFKFDQYSPEKLFKLMEED